LYKPIGGFFVGCSIEGLLALGLVRFFERGEVETVINRARLRIDLHRSPDRRSLRSYFPRFLGLA
jgi:poly(U)-specific endoribonuclease